MAFHKESKKVFSDFLSARNLKMTQQRAVILAEFLKTERHVSPDDLCRLVKRKDSSVGQATIYRMLKLLSESGIAREIDFRDGVKRFEHGYKHDHHDHLICESCGKNIEIYDERIEALQVKLAEKYGFSLRDHEMYLYGLCEKCSKVNK